MDEIRLALRRLSHRRAPAIVSVITLAGAIGATAATWSLLSALLLHPLPVRDPASLVVLGSAHPSGRTSTSFVYPHYPQVHDADVFQDVAAAWPLAWGFKTAEQKASDPVTAVFVSANFFDVLGIEVPLGRAFTSDDDRRGASPVAVVSESFWRTRLNGDPAALGKVITLDRTPVTVVGVAAPGFRGLTLTGAPSMYLPLETIAGVGPPFFNYFATPGTAYSPMAGLTIVGRMRPGESAEQVTARLVTAAPSREGASTTRLVPINSTAIPAAARGNTAHFARLLSGTVALLLLIGCSTVGMLLLIRTEARRVEFATCLALGATRGQLARGIIVEGAVLAAAAAALSPLVAWWIFSAVSVYQLPGGISLGLLGLRLDAAALAIAAGCAMLATLLIALMAGAFGFRADIAGALRAQSGATPQLRRRATRAVLLTTQTAVALALVAGTGLFARSLLEALKLNARFESGRVLSSEVSLAGLGYTAGAAAELYSDILRRVAGNPAIAAVATSASGGGMGAKGRVTVDGLPREFPYFLALRYVDERYFQTMRMRLLQGRSFADSDRSGSPQVGIVSESFGRMIASGGNPIGRRLAWMMGGRLDVEIVGVTEDLFTSVRDAEPLTLYMPLAQSLMPAVNRSVVFRAASNLDDARREMDAAIKGADPRIDLARAVTIDERLLRELAPQQFGMVVLGTLGSIALVLTLLATYVLAESMAVARTREMGIRSALGATRGGLAALVVRDAAALTGIGIAGGLFIAWIGAGTLRALLFRVQPLDPLTLAPAALFIIALAIAVSLRPALRAARVDLSTVLRTE
jgi:putative ABC transport system permease protein